MQARAGIFLAFQHAHAQAEFGSGQCAGGAGETGADHDQVPVVCGVGGVHCDAFLRMRAHRIAAAGGAAMKCR